MRDEQADQAGDQQSALALLARKQAGLDRREQHGRQHAGRPRGRDGDDGVHGPVGLHDRSGIDGGGVQQTGGQKLSIPLGTL